ncbi:hypothetical protein, partial [Klebsiella pneumoniae]|uniref:hypothetical protein n=1 Tax=Klebsiella pneumoniae TaxID=573 RepID=UPI0035670970
TLHVGGTPGNGTYYDVSFDKVDANGNVTGYPVTANSFYELSACVSVHRAVAQLYFERRNSADQVIGYTGAGGNVGNNGAAGGSVKTFPRCILFGQAPTGATSVRLRGRMLHTGEADPYVFFSALQFCTALAGQTEGSPYVAPGQTTINGASLLTGSIQADRIVADSIT